MLKSFYDGNKDGIGDLKGITMKVDYLKSLGVTGVWLSPFFKSPMVDNGYDISDYTQVDPIFGNLNDFKELVDTFKSKDINVIIDFVPNHTSDQHEWFQKSRERIHPYTDYYVWKNDSDNMVIQDLEIYNHIIAFGHRFCLQAKVVAINFHPSNLCQGLFVHELRTQRF